MATPSHLRRLNRRGVLELVLQRRRISRSELARTAGISQPTVSRIVDKLLAEEILMESDGAELAGAAADGAGGAKAAAPAVGRPSTLLELNSRRTRFAAVQVGVNKTRLAALPIAIPDEDRWDVEFDTPADPRHWADSLSEAAEQLSFRRLKAVVLSLPGVVDESAQRVLLSPNMRWTEHTDLSALLQPIFRAPVLFIQELRALALGHLATETDGEDFLLVDFGAGVGGAAVAGGRLFSGPLPLSGELGHTPVLGNARVCGCGSIGCIETLLSRRGLLASAAEHGDGTTWPELVSRVEDEGLPPWLRRSLDAGAITIAAALNVLGLRQVVLTGCLAQLPETVSQYLGDAICDATMWAKFGSVVCRTAPRRRMAGMVSVAIDRTLLHPTAT